MTMNTEEYTTTQGGDGIKGAAENVASEAGRAAESRASETMSQLGDTLQQVAQAVRDAGSGMREQQPQVANVADTAANQVERASEYLRQHNASEALEAAQDFARRQPLVVAGGGLALGLIVGRLLKSAGGAGGSSRQFSGGQYGGRYGAYGSGSGYDRYGGESYAGGTYGGSSFGGSTVAGSTGTDYATGGSGFDTAGTGYGSAGLGDAAGTSTIAAGQSIDDGGAIDTGQGVTPDGAYDRDVVGLADRSVDEER